MKHLAAPSFWQRFEKLPQDIQTLARSKYELLKGDPQHPSLHFKRIAHLRSVRVGLHYRALGTDVEEGVLWFWIGSHADYDQLIS